MQRINFIKRAMTVIALAGVALLAACTSPSTNQEAETKNETKEPMESKEVIAHYVLFWLNDDLSEQEVNDFSAFFEELKAIPEIKSLHYGRAAASHPRDVVDNSFSYNLLVYFDSMDDLNVYETHPIHVDAIEKYSKYWNKVMVHDSWLK